MYVSIILQDRYVRHGYTTLPLMEELHILRKQSALTQRVADGHLNFN